MTLSEYLKNARENKNMAQEEAAKKIGVALNTIKGWEKGSVPKRNIIDEIIKVYGLRRQEFRQYMIEELIPFKDDEEVPWNKEGVLLTLDYNYIYDYIFKDKAENDFYSLQSKTLLRNSIKVLSNLYKQVTLENLVLLANNVQNKGKTILSELSKKEYSDSIKDQLIQNQNMLIISWFVTDYYTGLGTSRIATKTFEQCTEIRERLNNIYFDLIGN